MTEPVTTPRAIRPDGLWLDDLAVGQRFVSEPYEVTKEAIVAFASDFDPQPYHLDSVAAAGTFFDGLVASGWHTAAITMRLLVQAFPVATGLIGADGHLTWPSAVIAGDIVHVEAVIEKLVPSRSRPDRASIMLFYQTKNQHDEVRHQSTLRMLAWRRPPDD
ncbi:MaoC/PaaZ C-terminal domain-containing protein [Rhodococcus indonesiensis]